MLDRGLLPQLRERGYDVNSCILSRGVETSCAAIRQDTAWGPLTCPCGWKPQKGNRCCIDLHADVCSCGYRPPLRDPTVWRSCVVLCIVESAVRAEREGRKTQQKPTLTDLPFRMKLQRLESHPRAVAQTPQALDPGAGVCSTNGDMAWWASGRDSEDRGAAS